MRSAALTLEHVTVCLAGRVIVHEASVVFPRGTATVVVGRSGAGKSVLLKAAAGLLPRHGGRVVVHAPPLVFVHQDPALLDDRSIVDNMLLPAGATSDRARHDLYRESRTILARLGLEAVAHCRPPELSPSQARRAALARALLLRPGVLVVDEPTTGLDPVSAADVDAALTSVVDDDRAVIVITHHPRTHEHIGALPGARVVVVDAGRVRTFEQPLGEQSVHENGAPS